MDEFSFHYLSTDLYARIWDTRVLDWYLSATFDRVSLQQADDEYDMKLIEKCKEL